MFKFHSFLPVGYAFRIWITWFNNPWVFFSNHDTFVSVLDMYWEEGEDTAIWPSGHLPFPDVSYVYIVNYGKLYMFPFAIDMVVILCLLFIGVLIFYLLAKYTKPREIFYILNHNSGWWAIICNNWEKYNRWSALKCSFLSSVWTSVWLFNWAWMSNP